MINGKLLKELRENRGLTQKELGSVIGVSKAAICCYEKETRIPSFKNLIDLANFFEVSIDYLAGSNNIQSKKHITEKELNFIKKLRENKNIYEEAINNPIDFINKYYN